MPYLPYAKEHTQSHVKDILIELIRKIEGKDAEFIPYLDILSENEEKKERIISLLSKFYDGEQNLISNGSK